MGNINILDISVANLIAAGEVVDRPASAVKELLENALDAKATRLTVEIKGGGVSLIRVTDNGVGMTKEDAILCVRRHATSKIKTASDLDGIATLGFRGEALAAISAVSEFRIMTKRADSDGCVVVCKNGQVVSAEETGCPNGTTMIAEELFSNVPARRKFLRRDITETAAVSAVVEKIALSRPDVAITYIADGNVKLATEGDGKLLNVIHAVLGRDFANKLIPVHDMTEGISVDGYIGTPENVRSTRNCENFFINGRYVRCQTAMAALEQAFSSYMPKEKFPCAVLDITFNPAFVDVNVHPQKLEVKFSNEKPIFSAVYCAVRNAITSSLPRPKLEVPRMTSDSSGFYSEIMTKKASSPEEANKIASERDALTRKIEQLSLLSEIKDETPKAETEDEIKTPTAGVFTRAETETPSVPAFDSKPETDKKTDEIKKEETKPEETAVLDYRIAGVMFNCYIFVEYNGRVLVIDKHAAHERVNFEKFKSYMSLENPPSQNLLLPVALDLDEPMLAASENYKDELMKIGFEVNDGKYFSYPVGLDVPHATDMLTTLLYNLANGTGDIETDRRTYYEKALYQASCKASMKAGREDLDENVDWIVRKVLTDDRIRYCPHGRPVAFEITKSDFEKRFERK